MLDTNVWAHVADEDGATALRSWARETSTSVLVSPAVVFEQLRITNPEVRKRHLDVTTRDWWQRMMPEAYTECTEIVEAARRNRPSWVSPRAERAMKSFIAHERYWKRGFWQRSRSDPTKQAADHEWLDDGSIEAAQADGVAAHGQALETGLKLAAEALQGWSTHVRIERGRSRSEFVMETWQLEAARTLAAQLQRDNATTFHDWLDPFLRWTQVDEEGWMRFWAELQPNDVPTAWLRWASRTLESLQSVKKGSFVFDSQLATYLHGAEVFLTADKRFHRALAIIEQEAPFRMARPVLTSKGTWLEDLAQL